MFLKKILLASIVIDKKRLKKNGLVGSCDLTAHLNNLTKEETAEVVKHLNAACEILREGYVRTINKNKEE